MKITITLVIKHYEIIAPWNFKKVAKNTDKYSWVHVKGGKYDSNGYSSNPEQMPYYKATGRRGMYKATFTFDNTIDMQVIDKEIDKACSKLPRGVASTIELSDGNTTMILAGRYKTQKHIMPPPEVLEVAKKQREEARRQADWWNTTPDFYTKK